MAKATKKKSRVSTEEVTTNLKCMLTDEELTQASEHSARLVQEKAVHEADKKSSMTAFKARIDAADAGIVEQSNAVRNKYVYRDVACTLVRDYAKKILKKTRTDTNEVIEDRKMSLGELNAETLL